MCSISNTMVALLAMASLSLGSSGAGAAGFSARCDDQASLRYSSRYLQRPDRVRLRSWVGRPAPMTPRPLASPAPSRVYREQPDWVQNLYREYGATAGNF